MTLPKSHKTAAYTEQVRQHTPMTSKYGEEKGDHPNRKVTRDTHTGGGGLDNSPEHQEQVRNMFKGLGFWPTKPDPFG